MELPCLFIHVFVFQSLDSMLNHSIATTAGVQDNSMGPAESPSTHKFCTLFKLFLL